jgi:NAD(P)H-hydrate epimerase
VAEAIAAIPGPGPTAPKVIAVDIASGVDGRTGEVPGPAVRADVTVTFQAAKPGHVLLPGSAHAGTLVVADIGLPLDTRWGITTAADVEPLVPLPSGESQKRSRGVLLLIAGSTGMGGAPTLAALSARRAGTGLLVVATPASVSDRVGAAVPEALTVALPEAGGGITEDAVGELERWLGEAGAVAVGPGLGRAPGTIAFVRALLATATQPVVADADALFAVASGDGPGSLLTARRAPTLVTPHAGEFSRLAPDAQEWGATRLAQAAGAAAAWGATVLLKGNDTVIAEPGGRLAVNRTGTAVLATGGTGDVLTGLTGSLTAQGLNVFDAARLGAFVHGRSGQLATRDLGPISVAAGDVAAHLPGAFVELLSGRAADLAGARALGAFR